MPVNPLHAPSQEAAIAAADPSKVLWAGGMLTLVIVGLFVIFAGWLLARWMRLRHQRDAARSSARADLGDAWTEAANRVDPIDPDLPPEGGPPSGPHAQWQS